MEKKYEDLPSIHLAMGSFSFYEDVLWEENMLPIHENRVQALILQRIRACSSRLTFPSNLPLSICSYSWCLEVRPIH